MVKIFCNKLAQNVKIWGKMSQDELFINDRIFGPKRQSLCYDQTAGSVIWIGSRHCVRWQIIGVHAQLWAKNQILDQIWDQKAQNVDQSFLD